MTENADVEWLRTNAHNGTRWVVMGKDEARRLLAHIDQLEAENARLIEVAEDKIDITVRPTIHEIAAQILGSVSAVSSMDYAEDAKFAYDAAEALVAEGRRRDGLSNA